MRHFGMLIPSTNTTVEIEYTRLLPPTLQAHYARLGKAENTAFSASRDDDLSYQSKMLGNAKVEVIALTQTSASLHEDGYDDRAKAQMTEGANAPAITSAEAIGQAVRALGARKIALISPYSDAVMGRAKHYYESRYGLDVLATAPFGATDSYAIGALGAEHATEAFARHDTPEIEILVLPGGNFPTMVHIAAWEAQCGKPVLTTNQVVIWAVMKALGIEAPITGFGRLLEILPAQVA
jgi:maleate cis-trans isomerase